MNNSALKQYAPQARKDFIAAVSQRANMLGLDPANPLAIEGQGSALIIGGRALPAHYEQLIVQLRNRIAEQGYAVVMEAMAYTWFNRLVAIRYMELHDFLDHGYRVLSHPQGHAQPEILDQVAHLELQGLDKALAMELKLAGNRDEELYREILLAQCHALHTAMPFLFEPLDDATELLLPDGLLRTDSLIRQLVEQVDEALWQEIEIIGWLYQFYISEKKDQVIGKVVKSEDIPAATQLFTPNWIVKYMVQNSLGAQWLATYPDSKLKGQMEYYIEPAEQTDEVKSQLAAITPSTLNPEELTLIDPASGSGHILVEAYELFKAIYLERGYRLKDVPQLILEKNLYGLDIDERAAQLTGFALMMKGRADDRQLFGHGLKLNVMALVDSAGFDAEGLANGVTLADYGLKLGDLTELKRLFEHATTFGSLIQVPEGLAEKLPAMKKLSDATSQDLFVSETLKRLGPLMRQGKMLAAHYDAVVANPPYMGSKYQTSTLKKYLKDYYAGYEKDFFTAFIDRDLMLSKPHGRLGFMAPFVWMFISSHEHMRTRLIDKETIASLVQLEYSGFEGATVPICTFTLQKGHVNGEVGCFIRLSDFRGSESQGPKTLEAIQNRGCGWFYEAAQDDFKKIPGNPVAYWLHAAELRAFDGAKVEASSMVCIGMKTGDNETFVRNWQEISNSDIGYNISSISEANSSQYTWFPYLKGGAYRKWHGNCELVLNWVDAGEIIKQHVNKRGVSDARIRPSNFDYYFKKGVDWSFITSGHFGVRLHDYGFFFDVIGSSIFATDDEENAVLAGYLNSNVASRFLGALNPTLAMQIENLKALPAPQCDDRDLLARQVSAIKETHRNDWDSYERSWDFQSLPILPTSFESMPTLESSYNAWITQNRATIAEMKRLEEENNRLFIDAYGLGEELTPDVPLSQITLTVNPAYRYGGKLNEEQLWARFREDSMQELVSYAVGCMMGRYSLKRPGLVYAHSGNTDFEKIYYDKHSENKIFTDEAAAKAQHVLSKKLGLFAPDDDGIVPITDEAWFDDDGANRIREFLVATWGKTNETQNMAWLAEGLGGKSSESPDDTIRRYLSSSFFKDHLQTYKKRPIYWLFSSGKHKAFEALVYLHRYNAGTLSRMRMEYVVPLQSRMQSRIESLDHDIQSSSSSAEQKRLQKQRDKLIKQLAELRAFDESLRHYADQRIELDLDDGVKVNYGKFGDLLSDVKVVTGGKSDE